MSVPATPLEDLRESVLEAAGELARASSNGEHERASASRRAQVTLEAPPRADFGDYSTNAALLLAPVLKQPPREVAQRLGAALQERLGAHLERFEAAGPGFLNLFLADSWLAVALARALEAGESYGAGEPARPELVLIEFVSANPTGPMHVGHARNAAYGDSLARTLSFCGHQVKREFYVNDAGSQVRKLGESLRAVAGGEPVPEDGYHGAYLQQLAHLAGDAPGDPSEVGRAAVGELLAQMQSSLQAMNVLEFDRFAFESELYSGEPSAVDRALAQLERQGHTYRSEGALWLRTTEFGDDKDRVLVRSSGEHTYLASDIAYHEDKRERGFARQIDVWGADHHGYVRRLKAAFEGLGGDPERLELLIMQLVHLVQGGERAQMSKRAGEFVTLDQLLSEIGSDAARWYLLSRSHDTTIDLDLDLARRQSNENPVYYVQYAHARIASVLAKAAAERGEDAVAAVSTEPREPLHPSERALVKLLLAFPLEVSGAAEKRAPHRIAAYALELAQGFSAFYRDCRVVGAKSEAVESFRLALCTVSKLTIARCLDLLGVSAPERM